MDIKPILGTAVGIGSLAVVANASKMLKVKPSNKNLIRGTVNLAVGTALLSSTSKMIGDLK